MDSPARNAARCRAALVLFALSLAGCTTTRTPAPNRVATPPRPSEPGAPLADSTPAPRPLQPAVLAECAPQRGARVAAPSRPADGDPRARDAAQRGLGFVSREAIRWQEQHNCYGCHVQAVTLEALTVGRANRYEISDRELATVLQGMTDISGGHRRPGGLSVSGSGMPETSRAFGGAAFARYDANVGPLLRDDLLAVADQLRAYQNPDGEQRTTDTRFPVVAGTIQATTQALQTWRRAFDVSADERWLDPIRRAETWMQSRGRTLSDQPDAGTVDLNYAVMGLLSAGAQPSERVLTSLATHLRARQGEDGGWAYRRSETSNAFATGQTLHALRSLGMSDTDPVISRGTRWLITHQAEDGGWSHNGSGKAEAMWAVFGLVTVDVMSLAVQGINDGQHVASTFAVTASAVDNGGRGVARVDLAVDDVPQARGCGARLEHSVNVEQLGPGAHTLDVTAYDGSGRSTRRRVEFYTGRYYLARAATRWNDNATEFTLRDVAPRGVDGRVRLRVFGTQTRDGVAVRADEVFAEEQPSAEGPMRFRWNGHNRAGTALPNGRYIAELAFIDRGARAVQTVELPFVQDTPEAQTQRFGEVAGAVNAEGAGGAANTQVDLVDARGNVVQSTSTTSAGNYRFRNVDTGQYRVRVRRQGFAPAEASVAATPARASAARAMDLQLAH